MSYPLRMCSFYCLLLVVHMIMLVMGAVAMIIHMETTFTVEEVFVHLVVSVYCGYAFLKFLNRTVRHHKLVYWIIH